MKLRRTFCALLLLLLPVAAQAQRGIFRGGAGRAGRGGVAEALADRNKLGEILAHKDTLKLTADQVKKLRALDSVTTAKNATTMEKLRALRGDSAAAITRPRDMTAEQRAIAREKLEAARPLLEAVRKVNEKAAADADAMLMPAQRDLIKALMEQPATGLRGRGRRPAQSDPQSPSPSPRARAQ